MLKKCLNVSSLSNCVGTRNTSFSNTTWSTQDKSRLQRPKICLKCHNMVNRQKLPPPASSVCAKQVVKRVILWKAAHAVEVTDVIVAMPTNRHSRNASGIVPPVGSANFEHSSIPAVCEYVHTLNEPSVLMHCASCEQPPLPVSKHSLTSLHVNPFPLKPSLHAHS